ncbi:MAG: MerR family transcriptional regulator [Armatimonadetes bacterium]|nr:MAG: MerR family transcriptional regulator [Armatimonadota bacterium]
MRGSTENYRGAKRSRGRKQLDMPNELKATRASRAVSISTASLITGVEVHTLRYWEREFAPYLSPIRTDGGQRRYRPEDIQTVFHIKRLLRDELFSIAGAKRHLARMIRGVAA